MTRSFSALMLAVIIAGGACSRNNNKPADTSLNTDLSLAAQQRGFTPLDSLSAAERAKGLTNTPAATTTRTATGEVAHTTTTHRRTSSSGTRTGSSSGTVASAPQGHE